MSCMRERERVMWRRTGTKEKKKQREGGRERERGEQEVSSVWKEEEGKGSVEFWEGHRE